MNPCKAPPETMLNEKVMTKSNIKNKLMLSEADRKICVTSVSAIYLRTIESRVYQSSCNGFITSLE